MYYFLHKKDAQLSVIQSLKIIRDIWESPNHIPNNGKSSKVYKQGFQTTLHTKWRAGYSLFICFREKWEISKDFKKIDAAGLFEEYSTIKYYFFNAKWWLCTEVTGNFLLLLKNTINVIKKTCHNKGNFLLCSLINIFYWVH